MNTQEPFDSSNESWLAIVNTLGHSVLIETIKSAAFYLVHSNSKPKSHSQNMQFREERYCYMFVQGTGLNSLVNRFGLSYNPDSIKHIFNYCVRHSS